MPEAIKAYRQNVSAMRFIGKKYTNDDRVNGMFGAKWEEWDENGWFDLLSDKINKCHKDLYEDGGAPIGLMHHEGGNHDNFEYWIGFFTPANTPVPEGFAYVDFPKMDIGACWIYGKENEVFGIEPLALEKLKQEGFENITDWWFERYTPRMDTPDEKGNVIIDICFFIK